MLKFELTNGDKTIDKYISKVSNFPLGKVSKLVQTDIQDNARSRGWRRIPKTIKRRIIDKNHHEIFIGGNAKDVNVAIWQDGGTRSHFIRPVKKKALSWSSGGKRFFSKGHMVKGIKATNFFRIYDSTITKTNAIIDKEMKA